MNGLDCPSGRHFHCAFERRHRLGDIRAVKQQLLQTGEESVLFEAVPSHLARKAKEGSEKVWIYAA